MINLSGAGCEEAGKMSVQVQLCERAVAVVVAVLLSFCIYRHLRKDAGKSQP